MKEKEEYKNEIDWKNIPKDTKVLVSHDGIRWIPRYFKEVKNDEIKVYPQGRTSYTCNDISEFMFFMEKWEFVKLYKEENTKNIVTLKQVCVIPNEIIKVMPDYFSIVKKRIAEKIAEQMMELAEYEIKDEPISCSKIIKAIVRVVDHR